MKYNVGNEKKITVFKKELSKRRNKENTRRTEFIKTYAQRLPESYYPFLKNFAKKILLKNAENVTEPGLPYEENKVNEAQAEEEGVLVASDEESSELFEQLRRAKEARSLLEKQVEELRDK